MGHRCTQIRRAELCISSSVCICAPSVAKLMAMLPAWQNVRKPVIGMLHLAPLPGSPLYGGSLSAIAEAVLRDAQLLAEGGVNGLMIENFGDTPFFPGRVPAHVVAHMTAIAGEVRRFVPNLPLGINVLRNDGLSALAVAHAVGADYIDRKSTRLNSSHSQISYAVFCLKKKKKNKI